MDDVPLAPSKNGCPFSSGAAPEVEDFSFVRESLLDPPSQVARLRAQRRLSKVRLWDGSTTWLATHYEDVRAILGDPRFSTVTKRDGYPFVTQQRKEVLLSGRPNFTFMDAPEHTRFRRALTPLFTVSRLERMRPAIQQIVDDLLDEMAAAEAPYDLVENFTIRMPIRVLLQVTGVPPESEDLFITAAKERVDLSGEADVSHRSGEVLWSYLDSLLAEREESPGEADDIVTRLILDQVLPGKISREDAVLIVNQLLIAGFDNTANTISLGALALLSSPEQARRLREDPAMIASAVNEILRYSTTPQFHASRAATEDVEVGGQVIRAGEGVLALLHAANRDPAEFPEPDRFDIGREAAHHMTFSYGMHQCLGQSLARLELQIAFLSLLRRFPGLRLSQPVEDLEFHVYGLAYGLHRLPVAW
ncbi:MAG: cytochrome P450 [Mesorhizobium sp.]|nr:cytochrome P450 [Mesorhizobium sp.]